jgi:hypothetical protein
MTKEGSWFKCNKFTISLRSFGDPKEFLALDFFCIVIYTWLRRCHISLAELIKSKYGWVSTFSYLGGISPNLKHGLLILYVVDI